MKTKTFFLTSLLILLLQTNIFAQQEGEIIYTDFEPDLTIEQIWLPKCAGENETFDTIFLDFNQDNVTDIKFHFYRWYYSDVDMYTTPQPCIQVLEGWHICEITDNDTLPANCQQWFESDTLHGGMTFGNDGVRHCEYGVKYTVGEDNYYGWIYLTDKLITQPSIGIIDSRMLIVDKIAFCTIPNYPLKFGQMYLEGIEENKAGSKVFTVYPNPASEFITIKNNGNQKICEVALYNVNGQLLCSWNGNETIDIRDIQNGMYILKINTNDNNSFFKKIVIAK